MITVKNLCKSFGPKKAVDDISFEVAKGEVLGCLGPNGAGKSTTMRMITGYVPPSSGTITVGGHLVTEKPLEAKKLIGYLPENAPAYTDMTVQGFLRFSAEIRGFRGAELEKAIDRVVETCFLENVRHQSIETLSKGYLHRTCFAQSIIHDPEVLILDEPTDGLDPNQKHEVRNLIRRMGEKKAIIFSTHILEEVEAVCSRAIIIDRGRIVANGTPDELKRRSKTAGSVRLDLQGGNKPDVVAFLKSVAGVESTQVLEDSNGVLRLRLMPKDKENHGALAAALGEALAGKEWKVAELHTEEGRMDEVFRAITLPDTKTH